MSGRRAAGRTPGDLSSAELDQLLAVDADVGDEGMLMRPSARSVSMATSRYSVSGHSGPEPIRRRLDRRLVAALVGEATGTRQNVAGLPPPAPEPPAARPSPTARPLPRNGILPADQRARLSRALAEMGQSNSIFDARSGGLPVDDVGLPEGFSAALSGPGIASGAVAIRGRGQSGTRLLDQAFAAASSSSSDEGSDADTPHEDEHDQPAGKRQTVPTTHGNPAPGAARRPVSRAWSTATLDAARRRLRASLLPLAEGVPSGGRPLRDPSALAESPMGSHSTSGSDSDTQEQRPARERRGGRRRSRSRSRSRDRRHCHDRGRGRSRSPDSSRPRRRRHRRE
ncbi:hypothetical protein H696_00118 [Fonticula alba]|uniref:Uncharacterized protein n=1 Tax=Fonticula alba TaxID=691883 RepID=A0A058ZF04_FONAL|nr:hypothetical protein H696_00118 [Fonticula alba]KCV72526.1 hypothetical protein H696_00118 [Fonticula alba]|eukprot:XP_009492227.1 hypothetical protein H696_00118 [Fonticula alba]